MYRLSLAYDITPQNTYYGEHSTLVNGKGKNISDDDMLKVALNNSIDVSQAKSIILNCHKLLNKYKLDR